MTVEAHQKLTIYKIMYPPEFELKVAGELRKLKDIDISPPARQTQTPPMAIDKNVRSEYVERDPNRV